MTTDQLSDKTKLLRALRMLCFTALFGAIVGASATLVPGEWIDTIRSSTFNLSLVALAMIAIEMLLIGVGGGMMPSWTANWKKQIIGIITFMWSLATAGQIARVLAQIIQPHSANDGVMTLYGFLFFLAGVIILAPFQFIAYRAYAKRRGIPTGRICRSDSPRT